MSLHEFNSVFKSQKTIDQRKDEILQNRSNVSIQESNLKPLRKEDSTLFIDTDLYIENQGAIGETISIQVSN